MNTIANDLTFFLGFLFMLGIILILVGLAFAADALIRLLQAKRTRDEQKRAWRQFRAWIEEAGAEEGRGVAHVSSGQTSNRAKANIGSHGMT